MSFLLINYSIDEIVPRMFIFSIPNFYITIRELICLCQMSIYIYIFFNHISVDFVYCLSVRRFLYCIIQTYLKLTYIDINYLFQKYSAWILVLCSAERFTLSKLFFIFGTTFVNSKYCSSHISIFHIQIEPFLLAYRLYFI